MKKLPLYLLGIAATMMLSAAHGAIQTYTFTWQGSNDYTMEGSFSFDSANGTLIDETELTAFSMVAYEDDAIIGSLGGTAGLENFNFYSDTGVFGQGGDSTGDDGQRWNLDGAVGDGTGFKSGSDKQHLFEDGNRLVNSTTDQFNLNATLVPLPAAAWLFGSGLIGLAGLARRRKAS